MPTGSRTRRGGDDGRPVRDERIHRLGKTGAFVRSLDEKVLDGELDAAVHSMKDMPTERPERLVVAAVPERAAAEDVLVTPDGRSLEELPEGATVGTSSLRRKAQLLAERDDLTVEPLRGTSTRVSRSCWPRRPAGTSGAPRGRTGTRGRRRRRGRR